MLNQALVRLEVFSQVKSYSGIKEEGTGTDTKYDMGESVGLQGRRILQNVIHPEESQYITIDFIHRDHQECLL